MEFTPRDAVPSAPIVPNVHDEFGTLKTAVVSAFSAAEVQARAHGLSRDEALAMMRDPAAPPDLHAHLELTELLRDRNVRLVYPHRPNTPLTTDTLKDWVGSDIYCRDFLGVVDDHAVLTKVIFFRDHNRVRYQSILDRMPRDRRTTTDGSFTWGNALLHGDKLLVGQEHVDYFTDVAPILTPSRLQAELSQFQEKLSGIREISVLLRRIGSTRGLLTIPMNSNADLDCAIAPLPRRRRGEPRRVLLQQTEIHSDAATVLRNQFDDWIFVDDPYDARGCNILWLDPETPLISEEAIRTRLALRKLGYNPITLPLGTLLEKTETGSEHGGSPGGWRCMTGVLERANDYTFG